MLCNLVVKGTEADVLKVIRLFEDEYGGYIEEEELKKDGAVITAWIYGAFIEKEEVVGKLTNVKWMGFVEDFRRGTLKVAISNNGSNQIDALYTICAYDLHGDDRIASQYHPDYDFEAEMFWESAGESETVYYHCPCEEWWNQD